MENVGGGGDSMQYLFLVEVNYKHCRGSPTGRSHMDQNMQSKLIIYGKKILIRDL